MPKIGFSTGCLHQTDLSLEQRIDFYKNAGATAIEISLGKLEELKNLDLTTTLIKKILEFDYVSIHAPFDTPYCKNNQTKEILSKLNYINKNLPNQGIVIHPDLVEDFSILQDSRLPFLIENMDERKIKGKSVKEFQEYNQLQFNYVFDVQHAYRNDQTMQSAKEILKTMGSRLKHLHASGQTDLSTHALVHLSENQEEIKKILKLCPEVPKILEGAILKPNIDLALKELDFIKNLTS